MKCNPGDGQVERCGFNRENGEEKDSRSRKKWAHKVIVKRHVTGIVAGASSDEDTLDRFPLNHGGFEGSHDGLIKNILQPFLR